MDRTAIEALNELAIAAHPRPETDIPTAVLPAGATIASLEEYQDIPTHQRRHIQTERLEEFCRYVSDQKDEADNTTVFVAPDGSGAVGVIDYGSHSAPRWGHHKATLRLQHTPAFRAAQNLRGSTLSQRQLTDWIEDWAEIITPSTDAGAMTISKAVAAIRRVEIKETSKTDHEDGDFRAKTSGFAEIEARSGAGALPEWFDLQCQIYPCTNARSVRLRLSMLTGAKEPQFRLRLVAEEALLQEVAEEIELEITQRLAGTTIYVGQIAR